MFVLYRFLNVSCVFYVFVDMFLYVCTTTTTTTTTTPTPPPTTTTTTTTTTTNRSHFGSSLVQALCAGGWGTPSRPIQTGFKGIQIGEVQLCTSLVGCGKGVGVSFSLLCLPAIKASLPFPGPVALRAVSTSPFVA